jgi:hypothetical protein
VLFGGGPLALTQRGTDDLTSIDHDRTGAEVSHTALSDPKRDRDVLLAAARARVAEADSRGVARPDEVAAAGELLADLWQVGSRHGIIPAAWGAVTSLPCACLDVILRRERVRACTPARAE